MKRSIDPKYLSVKDPSSKISLHKVMQIVKNRKFYEEFAPKKSSYCSTTYTNTYCTVHAYIFYLL